MLGDRHYQIFEPAHHPRAYDALLEVVREETVAPVAEPGAGELFDLGNDPRETRNLAGNEPDRTARFQAALVEFAGSLTGVRTPAETKVTPEQLEALRDLGYVR